MSGLQIQLVVVGLLIVLNAAFAGSEIALISLRRGQVERLRKRGRAGKVLADLAGKPNEYLATIQIGITLAGFLASATAATAFADELVPLLGALGTAARPVAIVAVTIVLTFLTLVGGELAPKRVAMARAEGWSLAAAIPLRALATASRPAVWLLSATTDLLVRIAGVDPKQEAEEVSDQELREMVLARARMRGQSDIVEGALDIGERTLRQVMVPRPQVTTIPRDASIAEALAVLRDAGHSRAPLGDDLDVADHVVHLNDLAGRSGPARSVARRVLHLPETANVLHALRTLQRRRSTFALVIDEYGGGTGIVTLEDLVEEIVGEIYDEFDRDSAGVELDESGSVELDGTYPVHDLADLGILLPPRRSATVGGVLVEELGRIAQQGDHATLGRWRLLALEVDERSVQRCRVTPVLPTDVREG